MSYFIRIVNASMENNSKENVAQEAFSNMKYLSIFQFLASFFFFSFEEYVCFPFLQNDNLEHETKTLYLFIYFLNLPPINWIYDE